MLTLTLKLTFCIQHTKTMNDEILVIIRHKLGRKRLLKRAISSVGNQTYKKVRVIILSMNFDKGNLEYCSFLNTIIEKDYEIIDNDNLGSYLISSQSKFMCFLDDDDSWAPEYLSRLISLLTKTSVEYPSVRAVASHTNKVREVSESNRIIINETQPLNHYLSVGPLDFDVIYYKNSVPLSSCVFFKESVKEIITNHQVNSPSFSWPFIIDYLSKYDLWIVPEALSFYHFREDNDFEFGNYSVIKSQESDIEYKIKINNMLRREKNSPLLNIILESLFNKSKFHRIVTLSDKIGKV